MPAWLRNLLTALGFKPTPPPSPPPPPTPPPLPPLPDNSTPAYTDAVQLLNAAVLSFNTERRRAGVTSPDLRGNLKLMQAAQAHADDMFRQGYFHHTSLDGRTKEDRIRQANYEPAASGEIIASGARSVEQVVSDWMSSNGHRREILKPFTHCGLARSSYLWVAIFANPKVRRKGGSKRGED